MFNRITRGQKTPQLATKDAKLSPSVIPAESPRLYPRPDGVRVNVGEFRGSLNCEVAFFIGASRSSFRQDSLNTLAHRRLKHHAQLVGGNDDEGAHQPSSPGSRGSRWLDRRNSSHFASKSLV